jgi:hypothetical protein
VEIIKSCLKHVLLMLSKLKSPFGLNWIGLDLKRLPQSHWRMNKRFKSKLEKSSKASKMFASTQSW